MRHFVYAILIFGTACCLITSAALQGQPVIRHSTPAQSRIVVDPSGHGDFRTIQEAINSFSDQSPTPRIIFIRKGTYTLLTLSLARDAWRCDHPDDWGVATLNLRGSDITLDNLSIVDSYGFDHKDDKEDKIITCTADSATHQKKISPYGHQMALRSFQTTRLKVLHCTLRAFGGDTVSPWNVTDGFFYFSDCIYLVPTATPLHWGRRIYYYDCHKPGTEYKWYADNLNLAPGSSDPARIDPAWVFNGKWDPLK